MAGALTEKWVAEAKDRACRAATNSEETFSAEKKWEPTELLHDVTSGRDLLRASTVSHLVPH
jgi:hypothetical protein